MRGEQGSERIAIDDALRLVAQLLTESGLARPDASSVARVVVDAEVRGHASHGFQMLPVYLARIRVGGIRADYSPRWLTDTGPVAILDGDGGPGQPVMDLAAARCAERATTLGIAAVAVRNTNHVGMLAAYRTPFVERGVVGLIANLAGQSVAPPGGRRATLGNHAVCLIVPKGDDEAFSIDQALGAVACGKIRVAAAAGRAIPDGWLLDATGSPTTDARQLDLGGAVPVFGGYKGLGMLLMVEVLAGVLGGGSVISEDVRRQRLHPGEVMGCAQLLIGLSCHPAAPRRAGDQGLRHAPGGAPA